MYTVMRDLGVIYEIEGNPKMVETYQVALIYC